jgi:hypothetical protein
VQQLRRSLLDYMAGAKFRPAVALSPEQAGGLWTRASVAPASPSAPRALDPDLDDGSGRTPANKTM